MESPRTVLVAMSGGVDSSAAACLLQEAGWAGSTEIWVDKQTGVNYLYHTAGNSGGLTPLLNRDGTPVITTVFEEED
jgi:asparagine synthetase B (glutamine-hydrolysing)